MLGAWAIFNVVLLPVSVNLRKKPRRHTPQPPRPTNRSNTIPSTQDPLDPRPTKILDVQMVARPHDVEMGEVRGQSVRRLNSFAGFNMSLHNYYITYFYI